MIRGGAGVRSSRALAQVTFLAAAVDRPELQRLAVDRADDPAKQLFVFSGWHARSRLDRPSLRSQAVTYSVAGAAVMGLFGLRARRDEARALRADDPERADELGIGRPDLGRGYDDGGLVDVNTAPAPTIASVCGMDGFLAEQIVAARTGRGGSFLVLGEVLMDVALPPSARDELRDRAVL